MSFNITIFGPRHYFWSNMPKFRVWFHRPDAHSTGGVGFRAVFLHVAFHWGRDERPRKA